MIKAIADTHALIWFYSADPRLSATAKATIDLAATTGDQIGLSAISLVEIVYLSEKSRIPATSLDDMLRVLQRPNPLFVEIPVDRAIAQALASVPRTQVPDMPDRIIAATAIARQIPVISRDGKIQLSAVPTIW